MNIRYMAGWIATIGLLALIPAGQAKGKELQMFITKEDIDLEGRRIQFKLNKAAEKAEVAFYDPSGTVITEFETHFDGAQAGSALTITWQPVSQAIGRIEIKAFDTKEFWVGYEIVPFFVDIPHADVVFEFGKWDIRPSEKPKLASALNLLKQAIEQYGRDLSAQVYVGGFTDTVGGDADNQTLSERRAREIAVHFSKNGIRLPIFYRGFGEKVPAVPTGDGVPEEKNRRAVYILGAMTPEIGGPQAPGQWRRLP